MGSTTAGAGGLGGELGGELVGAGRGVANGAAAAAWPVGGWHPAAWEHATTIAAGVRLRQAHVVGDLNVPERVRDMVNGRGTPCVYSRDAALASLRPGAMP